MGKKNWQSSNSEPTGHNTSSNEPFHESDGSGTKSKDYNPLVDLWRREYELNVEFWNQLFGVYMYGENTPTSSTVEQMPYNHVQPVGGGPKETLDE